MLGLGYGAVTCLSRFGTVVATLIYIAIITLTGVSLAYLFSSGATIFVIVGIMFSLNALFIFYLNISSGLFRPLIFMAVSGIIAAIVVNSLVASSTMVWIVSMLTVLVWTLFWLAFCEAKDVTRAIKNGGEDFNKKCPPALISHFITGLSWEHSLPNPAPVCAFSFMLLVGGVCSAHFVFDKFILYWPLNIIIYFGSAIGMMLCVMAEVWLIAKGFILGLRLCVLLFLLNIMLCGTGLFDVLCHQNSELKSDLIIAIIMVVLCRWVMNGETFTMMIRFCLGRRLVRVALQEYLTSQTRK